MDVLHHRIIPPYYCDAGSHNGMMGVPITAIVYMTVEEFEASGGEVDIVVKQKEHEHK